MRDNGDTVALAFSGGLASAMLLRFLASIRSGPPDDDEYPERGYCKFDLHAIHVDTATSEDPIADIWRNSFDLQENGNLKGVQLHCLRIEDVFDEDPDRKSKLQALLDSAIDATAREDLLTVLTWHLIINKAQSLNCNKLLRGDCSTRLAVRLVAQSCKGRGYSIPADTGCIADARHKNPVVFYPFREVSLKELAMAAHYYKLQYRTEQPSLILSSGKNNSINILSEGFVSALQEQNPGAIGNLLSVASRLKGFDFSDPPDMIQTISERNRRKKLPGQCMADKAQLKCELFCMLCFAPLPPSNQIKDYCWVCRSQLLTSRAAIDGLPKMERSEMKELISGYLLIHE